MATKSFFKDIVIKDKKRASAFLCALENAEGKKKKTVNYKAPIKTVKDQETIKKMFK